MLLKGISMKIVIKLVTALSFSTLAASARAWDCHTDGKPHSWTVTLQQMDISVELVGALLNVPCHTMCRESLLKFPRSNVRSHRANSAPTLLRHPGFQHCSYLSPYPRRGRHFLISMPAPVARASSSSSHFSTLPGYPLGGFIDTVDSAIPPDFSPHGWSSGGIRGRKEEHSLFALQRFYPQPGEAPVCGSG